MIICLREKETWVLLVTPVQWKQNLSETRRKYSLEGLIFFLSLLKFHFNQDFSSGSK